MNLEIETSLISCDFLKEFISEMYDVEYIINCELLQSSFSDTYKLNTSKQSYIFKIYKHDFKHLPDLEFEIDFVNYLSSEYCEVANYIQTVEGLSIVIINAPEGVRYGVLLDFADGNELSYQDGKDAFLYGVSVAKIHKISKNFTFKHHIKEINIVSMLQDSSIAVNTFLKNNINDKNYFNYMIDFLNEKAGSVDLDSLEKNFCHGDLHGGNAHRNLKTLTFFDFDFCGYGPIGYDLSVFRWGCMIGHRIPMWQEFIKGYKTINYLEEKELKNSLLFVAIRDLFVMTSYLNRTRWTGRLSINDYYIQNRIDFFKKIKIQL